MKKTTCSCWRYWRRIICTSGCYPAVVALILTAGLLLDLISSSGCHLVELSVGFTPSNKAWNSSEIDMGLFYYYDKNAATSMNKYQEIFHGGCVRYRGTFQERIINKDRTWLVGRVMALLSLLASLLATLTAWLIVLTPVPVGCIWNGILLPMTMLCFTAQGSKFLIFDMALCRSEVWFRNEFDSSPEIAKSCKLGESGYYGIAAGAMYLIALLCVCLKTPVKRKLDPNFGIKNRDASRDSDSYLDVNEASVQHDDNCPYDEEDKYTPSGTFEDDEIYINETNPSENDPGSTSDSSTASPSGPLSVDNTRATAEEAVQGTSIQGSQSRPRVSSKIQYLESSESYERQLQGELQSSLRVVR